MQYIDNGPDIPDKLIEAQKEREVIFICGAGVSSHLAKLPLFKSLIDDIYLKLGEVKQDQEKETFEKNDFDETLWALEQRLGGRKGRKKIIEKIHKILAEPYITISDDKLEYHKILLELSGDNPLITTNFDTLFEKSTQDIKSHTGPAFPDMQDEEEFQGVIHLHGRVSDNNKNLENSPLILTMRDFAEAYMREGWAARFLYKIIRKYNIVFIGYSAEDYFLKLLLSAISEDKNVFPDIKGIYAFTEEDNESFWKTFGATTISFKDEGYEILYQSLKKWGYDVQNPNSKREDIRNAMARSPEEVLND